MKETFVRLNEDQMNLILYCIEQQSYELDSNEYTLCEGIIDSFKHAITELNVK